MIIYLQVVSKMKQQQIMYNCEYVYINLNS